MCYRLPSQKKEEKHNKTILYKNSNYNLKLNTKNKKKNPRKSCRAKRKCENIYILYTDIEFILIFLLLIYLYIIFFCV